MRVVVGDDAPDREFKPSPDVDFGELVSELRRDTLPNHRVYEAFLEAHRAERDAPVRAPGMVLSSATEAFLRRYESAPPEARSHSWWSVMTLEMHRRRLRHDMPSEATWAVLLRSAIDVAEDAEDGSPELRDLARLYAVDAMLRAGPSRLEASEVRAAVDAMLDLEDDTSFADAFQALSSLGQVVVVNGALLRRAGDLYDAGWPRSSFDELVASNGAMMAIASGNADLAAEWVGRMDASVRSSCRSEMTDPCSRRLRDLATALGHLSAIDDIVPPTPHAAAVAAVLACDEELPLEPGSYTLESVPADFAACVQGRLPLSCDFDAIVVR